MKSIKKYLLGIETEIAEYVKKAGYCQDHSKQHHELCILPNSLSAHIKWVSKDFNETTFFYRGAVLFIAKIWTENGKLGAVNLQYSDKITKGYIGEKIEDEMSFYYLGFDGKEKFTEKMYTIDETLTIIEKCFRPMFTKLKLRLSLAEARRLESEKEVTIQKEIRKEQHLNKIKSFINQ